MILTVTLNPAVDFTVYGKAFKVNETNRGRLTDPDPGGKGNNVARIARLLGTDVIATGFLGGFTGDFIESGLKNEGIKTDFLHIDSLCRITVAYIDEATSAETKIVPFGPEITGSEKEKFTGHYQSLLAGNSFSSVILSGSVPGSLPDDYYGALIDIARKFGVRVILDTSGAALASGMRHTPFLIKPNREEAKELVGGGEDSQMYRFFEDTAAKGTIVALTLGQQGAVLFTKNGIYQTRPQAVKAVNPVGAGDAFVGGFASALDRFGEKDETPFSWAAAAGTAAAASKGLLFSTDMFYRIKENLIVETIKGIV